MGAPPMVRLAAVPSLAPRVPSDPSHRSELDRHERDLPRRARPVPGVALGARTR